MPNPELLNASEPELRLRIALLAFLRLARAQGHVNGIAESIEVARALTLIDILDKNAVRTCLRALVCSNQRHRSFLSCSVSKLPQDLIQPVTCAKIFRYLRQKLDTILKGKSTE